MRLQATTLLVRSTQALFSLACVLVAAYAFFFLLMPVREGDPFAARFAVAGWDVPAHFFGAGLALLLVPVQLSQGIRRRWPMIHRICGRVSAVAILVGGVSGLSMAQEAHGGWVSRAGFSALALLWLGITANGLRLAIRRDLPRHRTWMAYSVALTTGAITFRVMLGVCTGVMEWPFTPVYVTVSWVSWLFNLAACAGWLALSRRRRPVPYPAPVAVPHADAGRRWASRPPAA
jgi:hypothetical protein